MSWIYRGGNVREMLLAHDCADFPGATTGHAPFLFAQSVSERPARFHEEAPGLITHLALHLEGSRRNSARLSGEAAKASRSLHRLETGTALLVRCPLKVCGARPRDGCKLRKLNRPHAARIHALWDFVHNIVGLPS